MKKQFLFIAVISAAVFVSCSKEKNETPASPVETQSVNKANPGLVINTLNIGLLGRYEFDGNVKDLTGQLEDGWPTVSRVPVAYTTDRKGQTNKALYLNGTYGMDLSDIPYTPTSCSVSFWVKDNFVEGPTWKLILAGSEAFNFIQNENEFNCSFQINGGIIQETGTPPLDGKWHHIAATHDNTSMKLYIDGVLVGTAPTPAANYKPYQLHNYTMGYIGTSYWKGAIDDVRFYKRVLSPSEINQLKNL